MGRQEEKLRSWSLCIVQGLQQKIQLDIVHFVVEQELGVRQVEQVGWQGLE
jgi:hypothetical protein